MALSTVTITYDIADLVGVDFDARRTKVYVTTNADSVIDTEGNKIRVGDGLGTLAADGTGSISVWVPGTGSNPATWQTYVHIDYAPRSPGAKRETLTYGPFTITAAGDLADLVQEQVAVPTASASDYADDAAVSATAADASADTAATSATASAASATSAAASATEAEAAAALAEDISNIATPDALVETLVENPASLTAIALSATIDAGFDAATSPGGAITNAIAASAVIPQRVVAFGDSITDDGYFDAGSDVAYPHVGWWPWANAFLGWAYDLLADAGISGNSLAQMIARIDSDVLVHNPTWVWMDGGVNSINDGLSAATITAQFETIFTRFRDAGVRVLCVTVNPSGFFDSAENAVRLEVNQWLRDYGSANRGVIVVDTAPYIQDPAGLGPAAGMTRDTLHMTARGAQAMGYAVAKALAPITVPVTPLTSGADTTNLLAGKGMFPGNNGSGLAADWTGPYTAGADPTFDKVPRTDGILGEWQEVTVAPGANVVGIHPAAITTGFAVGETWYAAVEFEIDGIDTAAPTNQVTTELVLNFFDASSNIIAASHFGYDSSGPTGGSQTFPLPLSGVMRTPKITIPPGTNSIMPVLWARGGGTRRWARCDVRKVA